MIIFIIHQAADNFFSVIVVNYLVSDIKTFSSQQNKCLVCFSQNFKTLKSSCF